MDDFNLLIHRFFEKRNPKSLRKKGIRRKRLRKWNEVKHLQSKLGIKIY